MPPQLMHLPDGTKLPAAKGREVIQKYLVEHAAVVDLYDATVEPHDEVTAIDLLSLNALNAYAGTAPMTPMSTLWKCRDEIGRRVALITRSDVTTLSDKQLADEIPKVCHALASVEVVKGFGGAGTRSAKLLHRLRPNLVPIWDQLVGEWYGDHATVSFRNYFAIIPK